MSSVLRVRTADVNASKRLNYWNDHVASIYGGMSVNSFNPDFDASLTYVDVGEIGFMRARSTESIVRRSGNSRQQETILLHLQVQGHSLNQQGRSEVLLQPGDFTICENRSFYSLKVSNDSDIVALELPYTLASAHVPDIASRVIKHYSSCSLNGRLVFNMLQTIQTECELQGYENLDLTGLQGLLMEAIAQLILRSPAADTRDSRKTSFLMQKVKTIVQQRLGDEELTTELIAELVGLSERRVQALFAAQDITPTSYIRNARLAWAAERLQFEPATSVTKIAHEAGFSDSAYFARCFRKKFGVSPKDYRTR